MRHLTLTLTPALRLACLCAALSPAALLAQTAPAPGAAASAPAAPKPPAGGIYKWKDASGKMQYSDKPPAPNASSMKLNNDAPSAAEAQAARDRLEAMKAESASRAAARNTPTGAPADAGANTGPAADESACQAKWREYNESYACFDPYRLVGGGIRPEAFEKCKVVKQPSEPCK